MNVSTFNYSSGSSTLEENGKHADHAVGIPFTLKVGLGVGLGVVALVEPALKVLDD